MGAGLGERQALGTPEVTASISALGYLRGRHLPGAPTEPGAHFICLPASATKPLGPRAEPDPSYPSLGVRDQDSPALRWDSWGHTPCWSWWYHSVKMIHSSYSVASGLEARQAWEPSPWLSPGHQRPSLPIVPALHLRGPGLEPGSWNPSSTNHSGCVTLDLGLQLPPLQNEDDDGTCLTGLG